MKPKPVEQVCFGCGSKARYQRGFCKGFAAAARVERCARFARSPGFLGFARIGLVPVGTSGYT